jgi:phospholipid transport system substrate-binding protein
VLNSFNLQEKMKLIKKIALIITICCSSFSFLGSALAAPDPTAQLQPFLDRVIDILGQADDTQKGHNEKVDEVMEIAREAFDFREMSKRVLGRQWRSLSPEEQDQFTGLFTDLLKYAYVTQIDKYSNQKVQYVNQRIKGKRAQVETLVVDTDKEIPVSYIMLLKEDKWKVYDVVVEGISLIRNYLEQFQDILRKNDFAGLTKVMEKKILEFQTGGATG